MSSPIPGKIRVVSFELINNFGTQKETRSEIWSLVLGTSIYENIFWPSMHGVAKFLDSYNLYSTLPITDQTYVHICLQDPSDGKTVNNLFKIYKVSNIEQDTTKLQTYIIHFISADAFNSNRIRINEHIMGALPEAVERIHKQFSSKPIFITKDSSKANLYLPFMTARQSIDLITQNASWKGATPDYCYWETFYNYNFKSLASCMLENQIHDFSTNSQLSRGLYDDFTYADFIKINDIVVQENFDSVNMLRNGFSGSTIFSYDPILGKGYGEATGDEPLSRAFVYSDRALDYVRLARRMQILRAITNTYYYINVPGLLSRCSGDVADVTVYNGNNMNVKDTTLSGKRLICGIAHNITIDKYNQNITLGDYYLGSEARA